jgi:threonine/homoserine/homoserine lactone efflux protein
MSLLSLFFVSFAIALSGALAPGPFLAAVISESSRHGFRSGPLMILGHAFLEIVMVAVLVLGLGQFIRNPLILAAIGLSGAVILVCFGLTMLVSAPKLHLEFASVPRPPAGHVLLGITMSLANPYWTVWWLTIGLGLVLSAQKSGLAAVAVFFAGHISADLAWYSIVSYIMSRGKKFISLPVYRVVIAACGITLIAFGIYFGFASFSLSENGPHNVRTGSTR